MDAGRFLVVEHKDTTERRIVEAMKKSTVKGDVNAIRWLEEKNIVSFADFENEGNVCGS